MPHREYSEEKRMEGIVSRTMLALLLACLVASAFNIGEVFTLFETTLYVDPPVTQVTLNNDFTIDVSITNVIDLVAFKFYLSYDTAILDALSVVFQFPFDGVFEINETAGYVNVESIYIGPPVIGGGRLVSIIFHAVSLGTSPLHLYNTELLDSSFTPIPHVTIDGVVNVINPHDVAVTSIAPWKRVIGKGFWTDIRVTVENQGANTETFTLTLNASTTVIGTMTDITLPSGESTTLIFTLYTNDFEYGTYTLIAYVPPVSGETDTADNTLTDGTAKVTIPGDINGDFIVNIQDASLLGAWWLIILIYPPPPPPAPPPEADINCDGVINIKDAVILGMNWLKHA